MKINYNTYSPSFNGRYKILVNNEQYNHFEEKILPIIDEIHDDYVGYFLGKTPLDYKFSDAVTNTAHEMNASYDWCVENCRRNGIAVDNSENSILWVVTGKKDYDRFVKYEDKRDFRYSLNFLLKSIKFCLFDKETPEHIGLITVIDKTLNTESQKFAQFIKKHPFKKLRNVDDIIFQDAVKYN